MTRQKWWIAPAVLALVLLGGGSVHAECSGQPNAWPSLRDVAPTARTVVIGTVGGDLHGYEDSPWFDLSVDEVLRGNVESTMEIRRLRSGLPLKGSAACRGDAVLYAREGDRIVIAFDGRFKGSGRSVTTVAWLSGRPSSLVPGAARVSRSQAIRALRDLPDTSTAPEISTSKTPPALNLLLTVIAVVTGWLTVWLVRRSRGDRSES